MQKMTKSAKVTGAISILILIGSIISSICVYKKREITGQIWFEYQTNYVSCMQQTATQLDNIVTLYINDNISEQDLDNHLSIIKSECNMLKISYANDKNRYPVKVGSYDYYTKTGTETVEICIDKMINLVDACMKSENDKDELIYTYLAYSQELSKDFAEYITAYAVINYEDITASKSDAEREAKDE